MKCLVMEEGEASVVDMDDLEGEWKRWNREVERGRRNKLETCRWCKMKFKGKGGLTTHMKGCEKSK